MKRPYILKKLQRLDYRQIGVEHFFAGLAKIGPTVGRDEGYPAKVRVLARKGRSRPAGSRPGLTVLRGRLDCPG